VSAATRPSLPPGPRYPRWLQTLGWILRPGPFMRRCRARYGDMFTLRVAHEGTWVFLADPDAVKQVFTGDPNVLRAGAANVVLGPVVGRHSVLLLDEPEHMRQRKLMLPPFHGERMQRYGEQMRAVAQAEIDRWPTGEPVRLWPSMQAITLEVIVRTVFGVSELDRLAKLRDALRGMLNWTTERRRLALLAALGPGRLRRTKTFRSALDPVDALVYDEIARRRADPHVAERDDILSMLVQARDEDGEPLSDRELRDELMTLLVAGHETTATSLAWALERLSRHPEMIERLREELAAGEETYLDAVVKETLRLRPVLPIVVRMLTEPTEIGGRLLPAGVAVAPCIYLMHRRADVYPEPERFRPERFEEAPAGTYTWIPFGGGVRRCLGASFAIFEMKVVLSEILARAELTPSDSESEPVVRRAITLTPGRGAEMIVRRRAVGDATVAGPEREAEPALRA
jgi:cytochrome P450 family 135